MTAFAAACILHRTGARRHISELTRKQTKQHEVYAVRHHDKVTVARNKHELVCVQPDLQGILPVVDGSFTQVQKNAFRWPSRLKQAVAVCNALTLISKNHVVGDISEKEAFQAVEAQFLVS